MQRPTHTSTANSVTSTRRNDVEDTASGAVLHRIITLLVDEIKTRRVECRLKIFPTTVESLIMNTTRLVSTEDGQQAVKKLIARLFTRWRDTMNRVLSDKRHSSLLLGNTFNNYSLHAMPTESACEYARTMEMFYVSNHTVWATLKEALRRVSRSDARISLPFQFFPRLIFGKRDDLHFAYSPKRTYRQELTMLLCSVRQSTGTRHDTLSLLCTTVIDLIAHAPKFATPTDLWLLRQHFSSELSDYLLEVTCASCDTVLTTRSAATKTVRDCAFCTTFFASFNTTMTLSYVVFGHMISLTDVAFWRHLGSLPPEEVRRYERAVRRLLKTRLDDAASCVLPVTRLSISPGAVISPPAKARGEVAASNDSASRPTLRDSEPSPPTAPRLSDKVAASPQRRSSGRPSAGKQSAKGGMSTPSSGMASGKDAHSAAPTLIVTGGLQLQGSKRVGVARKAAPCRGQRRSMRR